jgi:hypothetical protein
MWDPREKNYYEVIENNQLPSINKNERWKDSEKWYNYYMLLVKVGVYLNSLKNSIFCFVKKWIPKDVIILLEMFFWTNLQ